VDRGELIAQRLADRIGEFGIESGGGLERVAAELDLSTRQLRRIVRRELGVSPIELVLTRRLLLAKQLLTETSLSVSEIAYASGFASLRRFNDAFRGRYGLPPTQLRRAASAPAAGGSSPELLTLRLDYRPPYDWTGILGFLRARALRGVESVTAEAYRRTVSLGGHTGWIQVRHAPAKSALLVDLATSLTPVLPALLGRLRNLFDLGARPDLIADTLGADQLLAGAIAKNPGLRVPGAFDGFELALRAILGQQVTVKAAAVLAGRLAEAFGTPVETPHAELSRAAPTPERIAVAKSEEIAALGIIRTRARCMIVLATEVAAGRLRLEPGARPDDVMPRLLALPGIGPWTAHYIAMRALRWPDAFPKEDVAVRKRLGGVSAGVAEARSQAWRPWRSYATLHLWQSLPDAVSSGTPAGGR